MFTGIIEELGTVRQVRRQGNTMVLSVGAKKIMDDVHLGDSIAVNGVCLTVVDFDGDGFSADVMPETFRKTNLKELVPGARVNLERAMPADGRFGGHIVQGHVDGCGTVTARNKSENAVVFEVRPDDPELFRYMIPRGSVALDGISLTLIRADGRELAVSIIPHTLEHTVLQDRMPGSRVNIECDLLGKYVGHLLSFGSGLNGNRGTISEDFLKENGFA